MEYKILYAEDDRLTREITLEILKEFDITTARNGKETWELYTNQQFDLMLLDNNMPELTGLEILKLVRAKSDNIPVIIYSSLITNKFQLAGADECLDKSCSPEILYNTIQTVLSRPRRIIVPPKKKLWFFRLFKT